MGSPSAEKGLDAFQSDNHSYQSIPSSLPEISFSCVLNSFSASHLGPFFGIGDGILLDFRLERLNIQSIKTKQNISTHKSKQKKQNSVKLVLQWRLDKSANVLSYLFRLLVDTRINYNQAAISDEFSVNPLLGACF